MYWAAQTEKKFSGNVINVIMNGKKALIIELVKIEKIKNILLVWEDVK